MQMPNTAATYRALAERLCLDLLEARYAVADWAAYASADMQRKYDLPRELARIDRQLESARAVLKEAQP